jgi:D-sedoheptulose 7-phosphate isomerase
MLGATMQARAFLDVVEREVARLNDTAIEELARSVFQRYLSGRFVYVIGNGGSGANASHLCEDLGKGTALPDPNARRLKILSLTDNTPYITAWANDTSYERVFVEQLKNFGEPGDLLIAISGSGNSPNILRAVEWSNAHGIETFGITGFAGGQLRGMAQKGFHVDLHDMGIVETLHLAAFHYVVGRVYALVLQHQEEQSARLRRCG